MNTRQMREVFEKTKKVYDSALLRFSGIEGYDVYNCSIPFRWQGGEYIYGRVERRSEWTASWVRLFRKVEEDHYALIPDSMIYQLEDPYIALIQGQLVLGGTHVVKESGKLKTYYGYFYRGAALESLDYFTTGPDYMKDIRLVDLQDGRIGVFSRPRSETIRQKYGSGSVIGFATIRSLDELTGDLVENAPVVENLFGKDEWGGCNQCYLLKDGLVGVIGHQCYTGDEDLQVYTNMSFVFDPQTHRASEQKIIGTAPCYPDFPAKLPYLTDCAFTSGIVPEGDGKVSLYSGVGDTMEGRITIDDPFSSHGGIVWTF